MFITYFFGDHHKGAGAQRITFWAKNIRSMSGNSISCDVITSSIQAQDYPGIKRVYQVPNNRTSWWSFVTKDQGMTWKNEIKSFFVSRKLLSSYDVIILSGGPFMHFSLVSYLKKYCNCRIILDFRDPFANNPRFDNSKLKIAIKSYFEGYFIKKADHVITVNKYCAELLSGYGADPASFSIIDNGYDIDMIAQVKKIELGDSDKIHFILPGSLYAHTNIKNFLGVLGKPPYSEKFLLHHVGMTNSFLDEFRGDSYIIEHGQQTHQKTLDLIHSADIGLIFTRGYEFESTLKIFDYIGLDKKFLIITGGTKGTGSLHDISKNYPGTLWVSDREDSIRAALDVIDRAETKFNSEVTIRFSKQEGLKKLLHIISSL